MSTDTLAARLARVRIMAGLTRYHLARLAGLASPSHVATIESRSVRTLDSATLLSLCDALGCDPRWLASGEGRGPKRSDVSTAVERARMARTERGGEGRAPRAGRGTP